MPVAGIDRDCTVAGIADDQIGEAISVQVSSQDLGGLRAGCELAGARDKSGWVVGARTSGRVSRGTGGKEN